MNARVIMKIETHGPAYTPLLSSVMYWNTSNTYTSTPLIPWT